MPETEKAWVRPRHLLGHAEFGDEPSGACWCADCDPRPDCACQVCRVASSGGLGVIWECDNCHAITETGLDDEPLGWLTEEPDEDDYPEGEDVPIDLILCADCRFPDVVFSPGQATP